MLKFNKFNLVPNTRTLKKTSDKDKKNRGTVFNDPNIRNLVAVGKLNF